MSKEYDKARREVAKKFSSRIRELEFERSNMLMENYKLRKELDEANKKIERLTETLDKIDRYVAGHSPDEQVVMGGRISNRSVSELVDFCLSKMPSIIDRSSTR